MNPSNQTEPNSYKYDPKRTFTLPTVPCIYMVYSDDQLLYIGKATNDQRFLGHHKKYDFLDHGANKIKIIPCELTALDSTERRCIRLFLPLLNDKLQNPDRSIKKYNEDFRRTSLINSKVKQLQKIVGSTEKVLVLSDERIALMMTALKAHYSQIEVDYWNDPDDNDWQAKEQKLHDDQSEIRGLLEDLRSPRLRY